MPTTATIETISEEAAVWRRHLHQHPELLFDLPVTSDFVAEKLRSFGCDEVVTGIAKTGVVGVVKGRLGDGRTIALRAEPDATRVASNPRASDSMATKTPTVPAMPSTATTVEVQRAPRLRTL